MTRWQRHLPKRGICKHKTPTKDGKYRRLAWENPYCLWRQDPSRLIPNTQGCFLLNSYVSDSYALFRLIFTLLRTWASGTLKTWVDSCFYCSNGCRRAYFDLSMASNAPTKLSIYFGLSSLPPWFFELEQSRRMALFDLLTKVKYCCLAGADTCSLFCKGGCKLHDTRCLHWKS